MSFGATDIFNLRERLKLYGNWCRDHGVNIGYPHQEPFRQLLGGVVSAASMSDEEAMFYHDLMCRLKAESPAMFTAVETHSVKNRPVPRVRETFIRNLTKQGEYFILGLILGGTDSESDGNKSETIKKIKVVGKRVVGGGITGCAVYETKFINI